MARLGFIDGADDMLIDMEQVDTANDHGLTDRKRASIRRMTAKHGFSFEWIAKQLGVSVHDVEAEASAPYSLASRPR